MIERGVPAIILRSLLDTYEKQKVRSRWNKAYSEYFSVTNGIRQGGVISPLLYSVYADELIKRLACSNYGCNIGHEYAGVLCYADDTVLISPTIYGLQQMVNICTEYGEEYDMKYNEKKTVCICFSRHKSQVFPIYLNGSMLECKNCVKYLGITIAHNLSEEEEIRQKRGDFIGRVNHIHNKYKALPSIAQSQLMNSYCTHLYGCEAWNLQDTHVNSMYTTWNIAVRKIWDLPPMSHRYILPGLCGSSSISVRVQKRFLTMYQKMRRSDNQLVNILARCSSIDAQSFMNINLQHISKSCDISVNDLLKCTCNDADDRLETALSDEQEGNVKVMLEIKSALEGMVNIEGFTRSELQCLYDTVSVI